MNRCPIYGCACSTGYHSRRCRCELCRLWKRESTRIYYAAAPEKALERGNRWRAENRDRVRASERRRRAANPESFRANLRRWREKNREAVRESDRERRRKIRADVLALLGGICERCGRTPRRPHIHHRNGDGDEHRSSRGALATWMDILRGKYPRKDLLLVCPSCHKREHGYAETATGVKNYSRYNDTDGKALEEEASCPTGQTTQ